MYIIKLRSVFLLLFLTSNLSLYIVQVVSDTKDIIIYSYKKKCDLSFVTSNQRRFKLYYLEKNVKGLELWVSSLNISLYRDKI